MVPPAALMALAIFGVGLLEGRPARMLVDEIAEHRQYGTSFSFGALTIISAVADSTATMALILSGRCSATFNPKALPKNSATRRYVSADLRASNKKGRPFGRPFSLVANRLVEELRRFR